MKFFLISILNSLGLGVNGIILTPTNFAMRIQQVAQVNNCNVTYEQQGTSFCFRVNCADGSAFNLNYATDGRRILRIEVVD